MTAMSHASEPLRTSQRESALITGAEWIAAFLDKAGSRHVFVLTGGACAFMIDAVARHPRLRYTCFHHEQAAAFAADAVWRVSGTPGVTMATSGPGATNLITGIATSFFDSIPTVHITGQVNQREAEALNGATPRQRGFQEIDIVRMVAPITKHAVLVRSIEELQRELPRAFAIAQSGRMGPVLIDVPMDVQQALAEPVFPDIVLEPRAHAAPAAAAALAAALAMAERPVVLWGGGVGLAGVQHEVAHWLKRTSLPFVASWAGLTYFDHDHPGYCGQIGVYGNRGANFVLQNADLVLALGSRLENRQRTGNPDTFATGAQLVVVDVDGEELRKFRDPRYTPVALDLTDFPPILDGLPVPAQSEDWRSYVGAMRDTYLGKELSSSARRLNTLSPYDVVRRFSEVIAPDALLPSDTGAAVCWVKQAFKVKRHHLFTSGGNSPMGYALPAAIGAKLACPDRQVVSFNGDGGLQLNIQELQTIAHHRLDIAIVILNNRSYGILKQFQDRNLGSRYDAADIGYSPPDFERVAAAYGFAYRRIESLDDISAELFAQGPILIDVTLSNQTLIEPKVEMGRPINDQVPYLSDSDYAAGNRFVDYPRPVAAE